MQAERHDEGALMTSLSFRKADDEGPVFVLDGESPQQISAAPPREPAYGTDDGGAEDSDDDDDFEFAFVLRSPVAGPRITAEDIFSDGRTIVPVYPVFGRRLVEDCPPGGGCAPGEDEGKTKGLMQPLRHLLMEERGANPAGSASEDDDDEVELSRLSGVPPETYCLWTPGSSASASPARCKKSNSTGSLLRWKIKDLVMGRSHSDGKEKFVFLAAEKRGPANKDASKKKAASAALKEKRGSSDDRRRRTGLDSKAPGAAAEEKDAVRQARGRGGGSKVAEMDMATAHRIFYGKAARPVNGGARRSFLPYKQELFGLFAGVNGLSRNYNPI